jgi:hypothetical protein
MHSNGLKPAHALLTPAWPSSQNVLAGPCRWRTHARHGPGVVTTHGAAAVVQSPTTRRVERAI